MGLHKVMPLFGSFFGVFTISKYKPTKELVILLVKILILTGLIQTSKIYNIIKFIWLVF